VEQIPKRWQQQQQVVAAAEPAGLAAAAAKLVAMLQLLEVALPIVFARLPMSWRGVMTLS
jgi:hypothetical protein